MAAVLGVDLAVDGSRAAVVISRCCLACVEAVEYFAPIAYPGSDAGCTGIFDT